MMGCAKVSMNNLDTFELDVLKSLILNEPSSDSQTLLKQIVEITHVDREFTGVGFYCKLTVSPQAPRLLEQNLTLGNLKAEIDGLVYGAGFLLYIRDGALSLLEGYSYDEIWPETIQNYHLSKM
jgi:hypothetical protein